MTGEKDAVGETELTRGAYQDVRAADGFAYGVIGADMHVFADRGPLYLLQQHRQKPRPDTARLVAQPSRMLDARHAIVGFTGRDREQAELAAWRDSAGARLSARWLHAPGGQGKTRLADTFAAQSSQADWKVITATHGPGTVHPPPGSHDLSVADSAVGVLLIVDYADRWPTSHLAWLFSNAVLHQNVPARLLLIARTTHNWPAIRADLDSRSADTSDQPLVSLPDDRNARRQMFEVARDAFATLYGIDPAGIPQPGQLDDHDFGLTLAVHMAALVAVDAAARGVLPPRDMAGLTTYLLDRERRHWTMLFENRNEGLEFNTPPTVMARTVFTAALTGALPYQDGLEILGKLDPGADAERLLADHGLCYPPSPPAGRTVLEPLYPDRLAEDFLALSMPGHDISAYPTDPWTTATPAALLNSAAASARVSPPYTPRAVIFLATAAARWPHVGNRYLYPLLRHDPTVAVQAGSAALAALADLPAVPSDILEAIAGHFPQHRDADLDVGIAAVSRRLAATRLAHAGDPLTRARIRDSLVGRLLNAGLFQEAIGAADDALADWRHAAKADPARYEPELARALANLANILRLAGRHQEALDRVREAAEIFHRYPQHSDGLAAAMDTLSVCMQELGQQDAAVPLSSRTAVGIFRRLADLDPEEYGPHLAKALNNLGIHSRNAGDVDEALALFTEAADVNRRLARRLPASHEPELGRALNSLANLRAEIGQHKEALLAAEEAVNVYRRLAAANPDAYEHDLAIALNTMGNCLQVLAHWSDALLTSEESVEICRRLATVNPAACEATLAMALDNLGSRLAATSQGHQDPAGVLALALDRTEEAVRIYRHMAIGSPARFEHDLARTLNNLATRLAIVGRLADAATAAQEGIAIRRRLAFDNPAAHRARLGWELGTAGNIAGEAGKRDEAVALVEESIGIFRQVAPRNPTEYEPELAKMLISLALLSQDTPAYHARAEAAVAEAIKILNPLKDQRPEAVHLYLSLAQQAQAEILAKRSSHQEPRATHQQLPGMDPSQGRCHSTGMESQASVSLEQVALGAAIPIGIPGTSRKITIRLPAGIKNGRRIRIPGKGTNGHPDGCPDDLYVTIKIQPHKVFGRRDDDLTVSVPITRSEAAHGARVQIPVLDGTPITIRIPEATPHGRTFRVPGRGLRRVDGTHGDLLVSANLIGDDADVVGMRNALIAAVTLT